MKYFEVLAKKFLPYVHSVGPNALLIHKVASVRIFWDERNGKVNQGKPAVIAKTICGVSRIVSHYYGKGKIRAKMCEIPDPNAVLCGRCHGDIATFSKQRTAKVTKRWAHDHLGCKGSDEVIGPYQEPTP